MAELDRQAAEETAVARKVLADAKKYELEQAGGLSDELKAVLENNLAVAAVTSENVMQMAVPQNVVITGGSGGEGGESLNEVMFGLRMYQDLYGKHTNPLPTSIMGGN